MKQGRDRRTDMKKYLTLLFIAVSFAQLQAQSIGGGYCTISDTLYHGDGTRYAGARVIVSRVEKDGYMISLGPRTYTSNADGYVSFTVPQGATCYIYANVQSFNTPPSGAQVSIPDSSGGDCTYTLSDLQPASVTVSTNAGIVGLREIDGSPSYTITGNDDTLEVSNTTLSNPSTKKFRITIPTALDNFSDVDITSAATGNILMRRASGVWVDTSAAVSSAGGWTDSGTEINLSTSTDDVEIGSATTLDAKLGVNGDTDQVQLFVQGHSTQTENILLVEKSDGTNLLSIANTGATTGQNLTLSGITANSFIYSGVSGALTTTVTPSNGELLIGSTGVAPAKSTLGQGTGITITNGVGTISVAASGVSLVGDTVEVGATLDLITAGSANFIQLTSARRTIAFWELDETNSDTLLFSLPIPAYMDSLEYIILPFRANASTGNYAMKLAWEFASNDDVLDNSFTFTNSTTFTISAPNASGDWRIFRKSLAAGLSKSANGQWIDGILIRVGGDAGDTATGNMDMSAGIMLGFSRTR